jgi:hypothetical protein
LQEQVDMAGSAGGGSGQQPGSTGMPVHSSDTFRIVAAATPSVAFSEAQTPARLPGRCAL